MSEFQSILVFITFVSVGAISLAPYIVSLVAIGLFSLVTGFLWCSEPSKPAKVVKGLCFFGLVFFFGADLSPSIVASSGGSDLNFKLQYNLFAYSAFRCVSYTLSGAAFAVFYNGFFEKVKNCCSMTSLVICCIALFGAVSLEYLAFLGVFFQGAGIANLIVGLVYIIFLLMVIFATSSLKAQLEVDGTLSMVENRINRNRLILSLSFISMAIVHILVGVASYQPQILVSTEALLSLYFFYYFFSGVQLMSLTICASDIGAVNNGGQSIVNADEVYSNGKPVFRV